MEEKKRHKFYSIHCPGAERVILFLHGIVEGPAQFLPLAQAAAGRGISAVCLLLPGHGGDGRDFAESSMAAWQEYVDAAIAHLRRRYPHILLAGHSMGGLLALEACRKAPEGIDGVFALGLPLWIRVRYRGLVEGYRAAAGRVRPWEESARAALAAYSVRNVRPLWYLRWIPRYGELLGLCRRLRRELAELRTPVRVLQSGRDEFVSPRTQARLRQIRPDWQVDVLPRSGHFYYSPSDWRQVEQALFDFLGIRD